MSELPKAYEAKQYEDNIYQKWEESGFFNPDVCVAKGVTGKDARPFTIVLPPPNATGSLHAGHAVMLAIEDLMIRYHRMKGDKTLWIPGTDHAAIATNAIVEKQLAKEGKTKDDLGREKFVTRVKEFIEQSRDNIRHQVRKMGSSLDWSREAYTWDEDRNLAVRTMFKKMYDDGLIYRGHRIVNWCPHCHSTLADDEVEHEEEKGKFYWIKYGPFVLATARPETKLGDTAVAVHPGDKRYAGMVGKKYMIPGVLGEFEIIVVADEVVDPEFGTGAVKVTPAHSFTDYDIAQRHGVALKQIIDEDGKMMANCGKYAGLTTREAREAIVADMQAMGLIDHIEENYVHNLATCYRCHNVIEPIPSRQWFIDVNKEFSFRASPEHPIKGLKDGQQVTLKKLMQQVVNNGQIEIIPDRFNKIYFHWIDNLRDWCISRQIWIGHQIPVWYKKASKPVSITFLRHGESQANLDKVGAGHMDSPLTDDGRKAAEDLGLKVDSNLYDAVYSSDLVRATETAKIVFGDLHKNIILDKRLREIDFGDITGKQGGDIDKYRLSGFPNGENYQQVRDRAISFLSDVMNKHAGKRIAIVAHSGTWKVFENIIHGTNFDFEHLKIHATREPVNYELTELTYSGVDTPSGDGWVQDKDVLDTWFSSGLWTFSTLGWPNIKASDLKLFHPTSVIETMFDILFFWVARMIMMSAYALGEIPFEKIYLHARVLDKDGEKMSKSKPETMIDPLIVCEKYGTDAVRMSLLLGVMPGTDMRLSEEKIAGFRNFTNKLWNIARYINTVILSEAKDPSHHSLRDSSVVTLPQNDNQSLADQWILSRLNQVTIEVTQAIELYQFSVAGEKLRDFTWNELADWYLEIAKIEGNKSEILSYILNTILKLWHPFMPFVTEQIWSEIKEQVSNNKGQNLLMVEKWPTVADRSTNQDHAMVENVLADASKTFAIVTTIRSLRADNKIEPAKKLNVIISAGDKEKLLTENSEIIKVLARLEDLKIEKLATKPANSISAVVGSCEVFIDLEGVIDMAKEKARVEAEIQALEGYVAGLNVKLANAEFVQNAPPAVVEKERAKLAEANEKLEKLKYQVSGI